MRVGVCDYPSAFTFPPHGYGGIERWLWAVAVGARRAGAAVHLLGPAWRTDLPAGHGRQPIRLEDITPADARFADPVRLDLDLLVVGHEYPSLPAWRRTWEPLGCRVVTFQHDPDFRHRPDAFDGQRSRLFCYSPEMVSRYAAHQPVQTRSVQFGLDEEDPPPPISAAGRCCGWAGSTGAGRRTWPPWPRTFSAGGYDSSARCSITATSPNTRQHSPRPASSLPANWPVHPSWTH